MILVSSNMSYVHASPSTALTVNGPNIKDASGNTVVLKGVVYSYFIDSPLGSWMLPNGKVEWTTFDPSAIQQNLDTLKNWGANTIVVYTTASFWIDNTQNFRSNLEYFIAQAQQRGIYVEISFTRQNTYQNAEVSYPYPPYGHTIDSYGNWQSIYGNGYINNRQDFVNLWVSVANALKAYPNVMFKFWAEPSGDASIAATNDWFSVNQQCINAVRATGSTNLIIIQWAPGLADLFAGWTQGMNWVTDYPLSDSAGNLVYSAHLYSHPQNFYNYYTGAYYSSTSDMTRALTDCLVLQTAASHPVFMDEMGADIYASDLSTEYAWFSNTLDLLNQYGIGYAAFAFAPMDSNSPTSLVVSGQPNYTPTRAGQILQQQMAYQEDYTPSSPTYTTDSTSSYTTSSDSTFGNTHVGSYSDWGTATVKRAISYTLSDGNVAANSIVWYGSVDSQANMKCAIYTDNNGAPGTLKAYTQTVTVGTTNSWVTFPFSSPVDLQAGKYWLSFIADSAATNGISFQYDSGSNSQRARTNIGTYGFSSEFNSPFKTVFAYDSEAVSIYVTYTTGNAQQAFGNSNVGAFGNSNVGAFSTSESTGVKQAVLYHLNDNNAVVNSIVWYGSVDSQSNMKCAIYANNNGVPGALIAQTQAVAVGTSSNWVTFPLNSPVTLQSGSYWLSIIGTWPAASHINYNYDAGSSSQRARSVVQPFSQEFTATFVRAWAYDAQAVSIYATYTTS